MTWNGEERRINASATDEKLDKLVNVVNEIKERVVRMETSQEERFKRAEKVEQVAYESKDIATQALLQSKDNEKDIELLRADVDRQYQNQKERNRWVLGLVTTLTVGLIGAIATIVAAIM